MKSTKMTQVDNLGQAAQVQLFVDGLVIDGFGDCSLVYLQEKFEKAIIA